MDVKALRTLFPVTDHRIFLTNAGESPLNTRVRDQIASYFEMAQKAPLSKPNPRWEVKKRLAQLLGGQAHAYALVTSTGVGVNLVTMGIDWQPGDNVVLPETEHWNNTFPWLQLRERGVEVRLVPVTADNRVCPQRMAEAMDERTRVVAVAAVRFNSGHRTDLKALSTSAHQVGALFFVDGIQAAGVMPLSVEEEGIDILSCAGFKWLLGVPGTGFLYVKPEVQHRLKPSMPGMFAAENDHYNLHYFNDARRYETGSIAYPLFYGWQAGLDLVLEIGVEAIYNRVISLTDVLIQGFKQKGIHILSPIANTADRSAILTFTLVSESANEALHKSLTDQGIDIALRGGILRVSPNFYNTEEEIQAFLEALPVGAVKG